ncbi:MAG: ABC transporter ATP-binding protein, partial [Natrinema limicola]
MAKGELLTTAVENRSNEPTTSETVLELDGIAKRYGTQEVIGDLSIAVRDGEIL